MQGMILLTVLTLSVSVMKHEALFFISLYVLSVGDGGHKPCVQTFAADQFDEETEDQRNAKTSFFNWWHLVIVVACISSVFFMVYLQDNFGWTLGIGLLPGMWAIAIVFFFLGMKRFLDKAMIIDEHDVAKNTRDPWRLCTLNQVEEVKLVLRLIPIWLSVVGVIILFAVAFYDRVFVPIVRKFTGHQSSITVLQRIGIGLFCSTLCMVVLALVESKRVNTANKHKNNYNTIEGFSPMSIWWLLTQYAILGVTDAFAVVRLQELFYTQMSEAMRSAGAAGFLSILGVGNFVGNAIIDIVVEITSKRGGKWLVGNNLNKAHLDYFYWVLDGLSALSLGVYLLVSSSFIYKKVHV
ncbi:hypothetical protein Ahy_B04g071810 [Arachis hypogaea]|uniref:Major facilitator superfamily (MFS) profile domain-containing protein n=1 Tax=Arachis hypogaea TaxID=3818 RepID=A0A444ZLL8_ARAHY|nr:hypothetical protein Ahy_B04g071810 [Arachis hypogaea]